MPIESEGGLMDKFDEVVAAVNAEEAGGSAAAAPPPAPAAASSPAGDGDGAGAPPAPEADVYGGGEPAAPGQPSEPSGGGGDDSPLGEFDAVLKAAREAAGASGPPAGEAAPAVPELSTDARYILDSTLRDAKGSHEAALAVLAARLEQADAKAARAAEDAAAAWEAASSSGGPASGAFDEAAERAKLTAEALKRYRVDSEDDLEDNEAELLRSYLDAEIEVRRLKHETGTASRKSEFEAKRDEWLASRRAPGPDPGKLVAERLAPFEDRIGGDFMMRMYAFAAMNSPDGPDTPKDDKGRWLAAAQRRDADVASYLRSGPADPNVLAAMVEGVMARPKLRKALEDRLWRKELERGAPGGMARLGGGPKPAAAPRPPAEENFDPYDVEAALARMDATADKVAAGLA